MGICTSGEQGPDDHGMGLGIAFLVAVILTILLWRVPEWWGWQHVPW